MAENIKAALWTLTPVALLVLASGGCVLNEFVVVDDPWLAACQTLPGEPVDPCCVPRRLTVCDLARAFFSPSPTCRMQRPAAQGSCSACSKTDGTAVELSGEEGSDSSAVAQPPSVLDEFKPPLPDAIYRGIIPSPQATPPKPLAEREPGQIEGPRPTEVKVLEQSSPFREEEPSQEEAMEVPAETGPGEDAAPSAPVPTEAPAPASVPADAPASAPPADQSAQAPAPEDALPEVSPPETSLPEESPVEESLPEKSALEESLPEGSTAAVSLTLRAAADTDADAMSRTPDDSGEALLPAPLPEDVLTATAIPLKADPAAEPSADATSEPSADATEPALDSPDQATATGLPLAPLPFSCFATTAERSVDRVVCSDAE